MNDIVHKIQELRNQRKQLENEEIQLNQSICPQQFTVEKVFSEFLKLKNITKFQDYQQKKMFVFVCSSMVCPCFLIGDRLNSCVRQKISKLTGLHPSQISHIVSDVRILYKTYKDFKQEADYLYKLIRHSLEP